MNQHTIVLPHGRVLLQEVPDDAIRSLPPANWQLIGIMPLSEEQAGMVVENIDFQMDTYFKDYLSKESGPFGMYTAAESFTSLLTYNNIDTTKRWVVLFTPK